MSELADLIRTELGVGEDSYFLSHEAMRTAIGAVLDEHEPHGIYTDCGHDHPYNDDGTPPDGIKEIDDIGTVCQDGYMYSICSSCCMDSWRGGQTELCVSEHNHHHPNSPYCQTIYVIAENLSLIAGTVSDGD